MKKTKTRKKSQSTKYAFVFSVVSMLFSIAMFVGVTYAWFTDTVTSGVTTIMAAGNMKVQLLDENNNNIEGQTLQWTADKFNTVVSTWSPGNVYSLQSFKIYNEGSIALKYRIIITGITELKDVIEWSYKVGTVDTTNLKDLSEKGYLDPGQYSDLITITAKLKEGTGSDNQSLSYNGIGITVYATQANSN